MKGFESILGFINLITCALNVFAHNPATAVMCGGAALFFFVAAKKMED